jgi:nucleotide-binding universal stress UspA family protein
MDRSLPFNQIKSIVCGVDFSRHSARALQYAAVLARANHATLTAVYAVDPVLSTAAAAAYNAPAIAASARHELRRFVVEALRPQPTPPLRMVVDIGTPAHTLVMAAERIDADLVVVGTHGLTGVKKAFFGSTTEAVLRRSRLPVLAIPRIRRPSTNWPAGVIVAPVVSPERVMAEAAAAASVAHACGATLALVHVIPPLRLPTWLRLDKQALDRTALSMSRDRLMAKMSTSGAQADVRVLVGDMAEAAARYAARRHASILVFTLPPSGRVGRFFEAAAAYRLVHHSHCPVLVVPQIKGRHRPRRPIGTSRLRHVA